MKILHIIPSLDVSRGGPVQIVKQLCNELKNQGVDVTVATTNARSCRDSNITLDTPIISNSVPTYYFTSQSYPFLPPKFCFSQSLSKWLATHIREFDLLHIHYFFSYPTIIAAYYANKYRIPYILRPAGMLSEICLKKSMLKKKIYTSLFGRRNINHAAIIHFANKDELYAAKVYRVNNRHLVLPNGLDLEKFRNLESLKGLFRKDYPQFNGKKIILFLSRIDPLKGLDLLIPALKILSGKRNDFIFVLAGAKNNNEGRQLKDALTKSALTTLTILPGFCDEKTKMRILADSDIFVLPSYHESFGMAVAEAMAAGLPVVISNRVNIYKLIEDYRAGIVVELDSGNIAFALDRLLSNGQLRKVMGVRGRRLVQENFDIKNIAKQMIKVYSNLILKAREMSK